MGDGAVQIRRQAPGAWPPAARCACGSCPGRVPSCKDQTGPACCTLLTAGLVARGGAASGCAYRSTSCDHQSHATLFTSCAVYLDEVMTDAKRRQEEKAAAEGGSRPVPGGLPAGACADWPHLLDSLIHAGRKLHAATAASSTHAGLVLGQVWTAWRAAPASSLGRIDPSTSSCPRRDALAPLCRVAELMAAMPPGAALRRHAIAFRHAHVMTWPRQHACLVPGHQELRAEHRVRPHAHLPVPGASGAA